MGFINLGRLNIRKRNSCASALVSLSDVQPPSVYKSHILNGPINKLYSLNGEILIPQILFYEVAVPWAVSSIKLIYPAANPLKLENKKRLFNVRQGSDYPAD